MPCPDTSDEPVGAVIASAVPDSLTVILGQCTRSLGGRGAAVAGLSWLWNATVQRCRTCYVVEAGGMVFKPFLKVEGKERVNDARTKLILKLKQ